MSAEPGCDGLCVTAADVGVSVPGNPVAYAHPGCPAHDPDGGECGCGNPDQCLSPTHGQIGMQEALAIRHRQISMREALEIPRREEEWEAR
jgi:hypothetical protein